MSRIAMRKLGRFVSLPHSRSIASVCVAAAVFLGAAAPCAFGQREKLPKPRELGRNLRVQRDAANGELRADASVSSATIRASVAMVAVGCTVTAADGVRVRGLKGDDFRLWDDGAEQGIAAFDAASTAASIAVVLDASPSITRDLGNLRDAARSLAAVLNADDDVAVVSFADRATLLLPFSRNRDLLARAISSPPLGAVANISHSNIYQAVFLAAHELFPGRAGRKAIILLTDGMDSGLGLTLDPETMHARAGASQRLVFDDVARELSAQNIELFVISTENRPKIMTDAWLADSRGAPLITPKARQQGLPPYTLYLAELERQSGGGMYFLREAGSLAEVYHRIALEVNAEYTLGFYPLGGARPGWHNLRVELRRDAAPPAGAQVDHRASYYVSAPR